MIWTTEIIDFLEANDFVFNQKEIPYLSTNKNCRKPNIKFELTENEKFEYFRCKVDIIYFAENYCIIYDNRLQMYAPIILTDTQKEVLLCSDKISVQESDRQVGMSTAYAILALHKSLFYSSYSICFINSTVNCSISQLNIVKSFYYNLPFFLKLGVTKISSHYLAFENYSKISVNTSRSLIRGYNPDLYILQEVEHYAKKSFDELIKYTLPVLSMRKTDRIIMQHSNSDYFQNNVDYKSWVQANQRYYLDCRGTRMNTSMYNYDNIKQIICKNLSEVLQLTNTSVKDLRNMLKDSK